MSRRNPHRRQSPSPTLAGRWKSAAAQELSALPSGLASAAVCVLLASSVVCWGYLLARVAGRMAFGIILP